jgi:hypothetical protein
LASQLTIFQKITIKLPRFCAKMEQEAPGAPSPSLVSLHLFAVETPSLADDSTEAKE